MTVVTYAGTRTGLTARLGEGDVGMQRERSSFMASLRDVIQEDGDMFLK